MGSYDKKKVEILDVETGYNKFYQEYKKSHKFLENFDKNLWQRFIPRDLKWKTIVDLWCGDGRISNFFVWKHIKEYIWIDISENMLNQTKSYVKKIKHDLNYPFPLEDKTADVVISLFTLLHIDNLQNFFEEVYRIMKDDGVFILFHHIERKNYIYKEGKNKYKISTNKWSYKEIEDLLEYNFFKFKVYDVMEWNVLIWKYFIANK